MKVAVYRYNVVKHWYLVSRLDKTSAHIRVLDRLYVGVGRGGGGGWGAAHAGQVNLHHRIIWIRRNYERRYLPHLLISTQNHLLSRTKPRKIVFPEIKSC